MKLGERVQKIQSYSRALASAYINADQKLALLQPLISDDELIARYDNTMAANGLNFLQVTLFLDVVKDAVAFTLDSDRRAASLRNVLRLLEAEDLRGELRKAYCTPPPTRRCSS